MNLDATPRHAAVPATLFRKGAWTLSVLSVAALVACNKAPEAPPQAVVAAPAPVSQAAPAAPVPAPASAPAPARYAQAPAPSYPAQSQPVYADYQPPLEQPEPIAVPWAPPPMLAEYPSAQPSPDAYWTGGYWVWREGWAWAPGRWAVPPRPRYHWVPPYYEHRQDRVVFVNGFWAAPDVRFRPPAAGLTIALAAIGAAVVTGHAPEGAQGPFVPPPPGSRPGLVVPAPMGTPPYVMARAPAINAPGMRVTGVSNVEVNNTTIDKHDTHTTVVNNINNVTIQAPAAATVDRREVNMTVPSHATRADAPPAAAPAAHDSPAEGARPDHRGEPPHVAPASPAPSTQAPRPPATNRPAANAPVQPPAAVPARPPQAAREPAAAPPRPEPHEPREPHETRPAAAPHPDAAPRPAQARPAEPVRPAAVERPRPAEPEHKPERAGEKSEHKGPETGH